MKDTLLRIISITFLSFILMFSFACTPKRMASNLTAKIMTKGAPVFERESEIDVAKETALALIKVIEVFQYDNPKNKDMNTLLARSYATYTMGFLEAEMLKYQGEDDALYEKYFNRTKLFYERGKNYGLTALKKNGVFKKALTSNLDYFNRVLSHMTPYHVPSLFWTAMNWGSFINLNKTSPLAIANFPKVEAMMKRVLEINPGYYFGGPHLFFGVSYGSRPAMFGGNMAKSRQHFEQALTLSDRKFLMAHVYYALFYALPNKNKKLYQNLLEEVLSADPAALPEARLPNELAVKRATWMLDKKNMKKLFDQVP